MTRSRVQSVMRGDPLPAPATSPQVNGVSVEEKEELVEEPVALGESSGALQQGLLLSSPTRSRLLVSIPMSDSKRKLRNTTERHHSSPQKHRRLSQGKEQHTPPERQSPPQAQEEKQTEAQDNPDQIHGVVSEGTGADSAAATVPSHSQPDQDDHAQESQDVSQTTSITTQKEISDNATLRELSVAPLPPLQDGDSIKEGSLDPCEGEQGDGLRTKLNAPEDSPNAEDGWDDQHRRKRARTNDKAEGDGIQDDDEDSDPEEDEENQVVPEYVLREMQAFEQGFNGLQGKFKLLDKIGAGTFSSVYKAIDLEHEQYDNAAWDYEMEKIPGADVSEDRSATTKLSDSEGGKVVALKRIYVTSSPDRIQNEIAILHDLSGHKNVVPLITAFRFMDQVIVVLPYFEHRDFREYYKSLPMDGIRCYFRALLKALMHVHASGIIHRDVKPSNFLYDVQRKTGMLVDFGLAQRQEDSRKTYRESKSRPSSSRTSAAERASSSASAVSSTARPSTSTSAATAHTRTSVSLAAAGARASTPIPTVPTASTAGLTITATGAPTAQSVLAQRSGSIRRDKENNVPVSLRSMLESRATPRTAYTPTAATGTPMHPTVTSYVSRSTVPTPAHTQIHAARHTTTTQEFAATLQNPFQRQRPGAHVASTSTTIADHPSPSLSHSSLGRSKHPPFAPLSETFPITSIGLAPKATRALGFDKKDPRPVIRVNRAGTRGFRAPEILFRHVQQTIALDIWSVGVILLCFLSGRFPFFHSDDDLEALLEIAVVFGQREMATVAATFNRTFITTIPAIKDYGVSRAKICRLMNPTRFGKPDQRSSQSSSRSSRSSQSSNRQQRSSPRNPDAPTTPASHVQGRSTPLQAHDPTVVASKVDLQDRSGVHKQAALPGPDSRRRLNNDLLMRGQDRKGDPAAPVTSTVSATQPDGEATSTNPDSKSHTPSDTKGTGKLTIFEIEATYTKSLNIVGTEKEEDFMDAIDLLDKLMALDPTKRITARQALKHRFLAED
ncbi:hypothetical protein BGZ96_005491 [Linnemannia gamsii]|uniref:non-specific serine/threonine protein kinase n=1 Tax=Linnemannia gamsii TaxID=64522 RepID=A0ABQ7K3Y9_9FUNG|nr:hypothetical protein BGZ96_005491 [Linnemannia gamsii]